MHPRHARRAVLELADHLDDLEAEARASGASEAGAKSIARDRIGEFGVIAERMLDCPELKAWPYRYPRLARLWLPVAYVTLLPAAPIIAGIQHAPTIARWIACIIAGAAITAAMMLVLQLSILLA